MKVILLWFLSGRIFICESQWLIDIPCYEATYQPEFHVICSARTIESSNPIVVPNTINRNIEKITLNFQSALHLTLTINDENVFRQFPKLKHIIIACSRPLAIIGRLEQPEKLKMVKKQLFNVPSLEFLEWIGNGEGDNEGWILPRTLKKASFQATLPRCDLTECAELYHFYCYRCFLKKVPTFRDPAPPLQTLNLTNNPLTHFTVDDIARFCVLKEFSIGNTDFSNCECRRLEQWIKKLKEWGDEFTFEGSLSCKEIRDQECSNYTLDRAETLRRWCKWRIAWSEHKVLIVIGLVFSIVLVIVCVMGCIWRLTKRFRKHDAGGNMYYDYDYDYDDDDDEDDNYG